MTIDEQLAEIDKTIAMLVKARRELKEKQRMEDCISRKQLLDLMSRPIFGLEPVNNLSITVTEDGKP